MGCAHPSRPSGTIAHNQERVAHNKVPRRRNPFNAIEIHPSLATPHEPRISEDDWVRAGVR
ncbi:hypothetical protein ACWESA_44505, partial [Streptomyces asiaticus]